MAAQSDRIEPFDMAITKGISDIVAQTEYPGLTNSEIRDLLAMIGVSLEAGRNKRDALYVTLNNMQYRQKVGNALVAFVTRAMDPGRYSDDPARFHLLQSQLNEFLVLHGYRIRDDGKLARRTRAASLPEAAELAGRLQTELRRRATHPELLRYCSEELLNRSLFHAISEAAKSIPDRVRTMTGLAGDGAGLFDQVFGSREMEPLMRINDMRSESDLSEQRGFKNLLVGIHGHWRNPRAHSSRVNSSEDLRDFYDAFALFSYVHHRLDRVQKGGPHG